MLILALVLMFVIGVLTGLVAGVAWRQPIVGAAAAKVLQVPELSSQCHCEVCGLPANPLRTHDGRYLCPAHKGTV